MVQHALLRQSIDYDSLTLTVTAASGESFTTPLQPSTDGLVAAKVELHQSPVVAYDLGDEAAAFFTTQSDGQATRLMYLDEAASANRKVLGSMSDGKEK